MSDFVVARHGDYYISRFLPWFNIAMSLGNLFQRIASVDDRFYRFRLNKLFEENQLFGFLGANPVIIFLLFVIDVHSPRTNSDKLGLAKI